MIDTNEIRRKWDDCQTFCRDCGLDVHIYPLCDELDQARETIRFATEQRAKDLAELNRYRVALCEIVEAARTIPHINMQARFLHMLEIAEKALIFGDTK